MTISTTTIKNSASGNGSTTAFTYSFKISAETEVQVIVKTDATGAESVRSIGTGSTNYSVSGVGSSSGGTVTFVTAPTSAETVVLRRSTTQTQSMDLIDNDPMAADTIETAHDKSIAITQELQEQLDRSLKISRANTMTSTEFTTSATDRASKILAFDSSGELAVTQELGTVQGNWAASTAYVVRDIVKDTDNNNIYICLTAHTSSGSVPISTNTDAAKWSLLVNAAAATTSAAAAASSATAAAASAVDATNNGAAQVTLAAAQVALATTQATNSASSASTSSTQATNSSNSATASASSASGAASSATAAASSATSAAASYDSFDDRYLGSKSSDPTVDNDGASLVTGALYFNSSAGNLRVYNGSAWVVIAADTDVKTLVSSNDTTAGYLNGKLVAGTGISFTENNNGSDETLTITNTGTDPVAMSIALG